MNGTTSAWVVLVAWMGLMAGVGAALRPSPPEVLPPIDAQATATVWQAAADRVAAGRPVLLVGDSPCRCDARARGTLIDWARAERLDVTPVAAQAGVALADADGRLRYAGDPVALTLHCGGLRGFRAWWQQAPARAVVTAPCACA